jgi:hypothetical protein
METQNPPSGESTLAKTVAMLRRATGLLKELRDRMERAEGMTRKGAPRMVDN